MRRVALPAPAPVPAAGSAQREPPELWAPRLVGRARQFRTLHDALSRPPAAPR